MIALHPNGLVDLNIASCFKRHVLWVLDYCGGDLGWAAEELGVAECTLFRWRQRWARGGKVRPHLSFDIEDVPEEAS